MADNKLVTLGETEDSTPSQPYFMIDIPTDA